MYCSKLLYTGSYLPENVISNDDMSKFVETSDEWIRTRTGILNRRFSNGENTSDLASKAAINIMKKGDLNPLDIDLIIVSTISGDYTTPSTACCVQKNIGAKNATCFDLGSACSGFVFGLSVADKFIKTGAYKNAIVIGAEVLSKYLDFSDRATCVLFGDGAAGAYIERNDNAGIIDEVLGSDGERGLSLTAGHTAPSNAFNDILRAESNFINMDGRAVFEFGTKQPSISINQLLAKTETDVDEIKYVIPHQANSRIVEVISKKTQIPMEKFYLNLDNYANTSAASIPIALNEMFEKGLLNSGDKIILIGFGGGLSWGSMLIEL